ncbi:putative ALA-interacting subunit 2 [Andrographis paniculata]|uniref:putative ALA-interacting subunit 2 n=1 Tax=Andrographis paniculata TaxID=175694 RepID=UPI0021E92145|nr:putative ALA-interacting subunit 2 [Andrographis paniculata]XP_051134846.1 putative ALA-interacting subunit 2 [Andrographis paniculata]
MDERSSSSPAGTETDLVSLRQRRSKVIYQFTQQNLPACKPVLSPAWVISMFFVVGVVFIPIGIVSLHASRSVVEVVYRYDGECIPESFRSNKLAYIMDSSIHKNCTIYLKIPNHMKAPIDIYYQLDNYYQNHRRYVKSRCDQQLLHGLRYRDISLCAPKDVEHGLPIVPCGLISWSLFNDTYTFFRGMDKLDVNRKNIAWKSDRDHKFGKQVYPFNFQNGSLIGGASLDPNIPLSDQEDLIVWMRTSALPTFRKLYGRIEEDLYPDDIITVKVLNNYNTYSFSGSKKIVLSTSSWLGGHNNFLGTAFISVGISFIFLAIVFLLLHLRNPRQFGDTSNLSRN